MTSSIIRYKLRGLSRPLGSYMQTGLFSKPVVVESTIAGRTERRNEHRFNVSSRLLIQIVESQSPYMIKNTCSAQSLNISRSGICLISAMALPQNDLVDVWFDNPDQPGSFYLSAQVIWTRADRDSAGCFESGLKLMDCRSTDIEAWLQYIELLSII